MGVEVEAVIASKIGFASHQNAVPIFKELKLINRSDAVFNNLSVELDSDLPFLEPKVWRIDRLGQADTLRVTEHDVKLNASYLACLVESLSGEVRVRIVHDSQVLDRRAFPVEILAKNEWGGAGSMSELLAAFVMPNDPAVDRVLKSASEVLRRAGKKDGIDGYAGKSRTRSWELASAIWSAVSQLGLSYALPPASFEIKGQKIRTPSAILENKVATCLDTALLFAAAIEQAGLNALLVLTKGHAFVGLWLQPQEFSQLITEDASAVRKRVDLKELLAFETTLVAQKPAPSFSQAVVVAQRQVTDDDFLLAVDIHRARMQRIRPLAFSVAPASQKNGDDVAMSEVLEEAPHLPDFDVEVTPPTEGPIEKLALWRRKLLDLTTRNRLLHLPEGAKSVRLICSEPAMLEDLLSGGKHIRVVAMPDLEAGGRDMALYEQQNRESLQEEYARSALSRGEVLATLEKVKLDAALVDLYRKARSDLDEGGANTLFLAIGFLKWRKSAEDLKVYSAPLILLPVKLERKSALSGVTMTLAEDEPRFNLTLLELLRHDFELNIAGLDGALPADQSGIDVAGIWNSVARAVRDVPGFEVTHGLVLGTFSFAKYLMWKDLSDRIDHLRQSTLVRHLIDGVGERGISTGVDFLRPEELDVKVNPVDLFTPLAADSSQLAAVVASARGGDFVLDGPPGTGKSQTIANMIAHNLALGRRVLFVAEKIAALNVVYRRLEENGLGEFCLELHSSKASKVDVLKQLDRAWDTHDMLSAEEWAEEAAGVQHLRDRLNKVVTLLHKRWPNGLSVHEAIGRVVRDATPAIPRLDWPRGTKHDADTMAQLRDVVRRLDLNKKAARELSQSFAILARAEWSNGWQESLIAASRELADVVDTLLVARDGLLQAIGLPLVVENNRAIEGLISFTKLLFETYGVSLNFAFAADATARIDASRNALELIAQYRTTERTLSLPYAREACRHVDLSQLESELVEAHQKLWFLASLAKKKVARQLASQGGVTGVPTVETDLPKLRELRAILEKIDGLAANVGDVPGWSALDSDAERMTSSLALGERLRGMVSVLATSPEHLIELRCAVEALVVAGNELLGPDGFIVSAFNKLDNAYARYCLVGTHFAELSGNDGNALSDMRALRATAIAVLAHQPQLKSWCDWSRVRNEADGLGIQPLTRALAADAFPQGGAAGAFETAYARWFAADVIDAEPLLRNFVAAEHMSDIERYRQLAGRLSRLSVRYIRAKLCGRIPSKNDVGKQGGFGVLKHELQKSRRHKPIRQLATEMGDALTQLAPCMLMSPLSIAQFLPSDQALFDLVIFDEASQIAPWDAIGSIARGKQVVIAGDPRQMPPTNFFNRATSTTEDDTEEDMDSILDECLARGVPRHGLNWHYRSRHESLIAFSNYNYYDNNLVTFPAAVTQQSAVKWRRVDGVYAKGRGRHNQAEGEAIVAEVMKRLTDPVFTAAGYSIGIITLNSDQQTLIADLLDRARQRYPQIEPFFQENQAEPVVVKNLETVQGDERDLILLGVGYGPTEPGAQTMSMNFGPLNKEGGWRRLNVAITRARREMVVFSSFDPSMIDLNRTNARAVRDLKHFIEFAQRGPRALAEAIQGSVGGYDSPFEEAVARELRRKGWEVVPQIGVSRFRIDLGIVHPDRPGDYLVGVECDGATYHSAATARDRDKVRSAILKGLGWTLLRVWSTEWWVDKAGALERLHLAIEGLLEQSRSEHELASRNSVVVSAALDAEPEDRIDALLLAPAADVVDEIARPSLSQADVRIAKSFVAGTGDRVRVDYQQADLSGFSNAIDSDHFFSVEYDAVLSELIARVLAAEAPMLDTALVQRVARLHGFKRAGHLIRERVFSLTARTHCFRADCVGGRFVWLAEGDADKWDRYRVPAAESPVRSIEEIPFEEIVSAGRGLTHNDRVAEVARNLGVRRLTGAARLRLQKALGLAGTGSRL